MESFEKDPLKDLRGCSKADLAKLLYYKILKNRTLKIGLITLFISVGVEQFHNEITNLLMNGVFKNIHTEDVEGRFKTVGTIIQEHDLNSDTKELKKLILSNELSQENKISLLKIKLDYIINGECEGKMRFVIVFLIVLILTFTISGLGGLALILEALYQLFQEGKIRKIFV